MKPNLTTVAKGFSGVLSDIGLHDKKICRADGSNESVPFRKVQSAFVRNFQIAGYFKPEFLRTQSYLMDVDIKTKTHRDQWSGGISKSFKSIEEVISESEGAINPEEFLLDNLFKEQEVADLSDAFELVVRVAQSAFGRSANVERNELGVELWMEKNKEEYLENAKSIGLIEEKVPSHRDYDETWIMGAARIRIKDRLEYVKKMQDSGINCGAMRLLTGERELWAEIDKITTIEEAKSYMLKLAEKNGIEVNREDPFDISKFKGRTYLRYADGEERKITETMMAKELFYEVFARSIEEIIDSKAEEKMLRPTTATGAKDLAKGEFGETIKSSKAVGKDSVRVAIISNQPYCDRQAATSEIAVREVLKDDLKDIDLEFEGIGSKSVATVSQIHSELGALISEGYKLYLLRSGIESKRPFANLLFQSRCNDASLVPQSFEIVEKPVAKAVTDSQNKGIVK